MKCKHSLKAILATRWKVVGMAFRRPLVGHPTKCWTRVTMENDLWDGFLSSKLRKHMEKHGKTYHQKTSQWSCVLYIFAFQVPWHSAAFSRAWKVWRLMRCLMPKRRIYTITFNQYLGSSSNNNINNNNNNSNNHFSKARCQLVGDDVLQYENLNSKESWKETRETASPKRGNHWSTSPKEQQRRHTLADMRPKESG